MVTSAAVPAVVVTAKVGTALWRVSATPSSDLISENSGLFTTIPIALAVSIEDPPPNAIRKSAPEALKAAIPFFTFVIVGLAFTSLNTS